MPGIGIMGAWYRYNDQFRGRDIEMLPFVTILL